MKYSVKILLLLYLVGFVVSEAKESNELRAPNMRAINFGKTVANAVLNAGVFLRVRAMSDEDCAFNCVMAWKCTSYNFRSSSQNIESKTVNCELSDTDRFSAPNSLTYSQGSIHRGIQTACDDLSTCRKNEICVPNFKDDTQRCDCIHGYHRTPCEKIPKTCTEVFNDGQNVSGVYTILPDDKEPFNITCDMVTDGGAWMLLQRRRDDKVDFYRGWVDYKNGFGDINGNFWLGNDKIHRLTTSQEMMLRFDLEDFKGRKAFAVYQNVTVLGESHGYRLYFGGYTGTLRDSLRLHYGMTFSTKDRDNDKTKNNCASVYKGGWWYNHCHNVNINGLYLHNGTYINPKGISWYNRFNEHYGMKTTEMKVRIKKQVQLHH